MKLNIMERFKLLDILPETGNFLTLRIINDLRHNLSPSEEEIKHFGIIQNGTVVTWNLEKSAEETEISIGEKATDVIVKLLKKLDKEEQLTQQHVSVYEKFIKE